MKATEAAVWVQTRMEDNNRKSVLADYALGLDCARWMYSSRRRQNWRLEGNSFPWKHDLLVYWFPQVIRLLWLKSLWELERDGSNALEWLGRLGLWLAKEKRTQLWCRKLLKWGSKEKEELQTLTNDSCAMCHPRAADSIWYGYYWISYILVANGYLPYAVVARQF